MLVGGCDVGSTTGKAVVLNDTTVVGHCIVPSTTKPEHTARQAMDEALKMAGLTSIDDLQYIVGTGYGRLKVAFAHDNVSEITCHARGAHWLNPAVRTVVDIGGQDCKVMSLDKNGKVLEFAMNDRCAAGTGRFFEAMARVLTCGLDGISALAIASKNLPVPAAQRSFMANSMTFPFLSTDMTLQSCPPISTTVRTAGFSQCAPRAWQVISETFSLAKGTLSRP